MSIIATPLALALQYMEVFYGSGDLEKLAHLFADDLQFEGPLYRFNSAAEYLRSLQHNPPMQMRYEIIQQFSNDAQACLIYRFHKPGVSTLMAQAFESENNKLKRIYLIFDSKALM